MGKKEVISGNPWETGGPAAGLILPPENKGLTLQMWAFCLLEESTWLTSLGEHEDQVQ